MKKKKLQKSVYPLELVLVSIIGTVLAARAIVYLIIIRRVLPLWLLAQVGDLRVHHFVYGNILILVTSFLAIGLGIRGHRKLFVVFYGIGLGLILDEFMLWMGDVRPLTLNLYFAPYSLVAVSIASILIGFIIMYRLYKK